MLWRAALCFLPARPCFTILIRPVRRMRHSGFRMSSPAAINSRAVEPLNRTVSLRTIRFRCFSNCPAVTGESSTPGHARVVQIDSFSLTANQFSVVKAVDSASAAIVSAITSGTLFPTASVLFFNTALPAGPPDGVFIFGDVVGTSHLVFNGSNLPEERDSFNFARVVPEVGNSMLLLCVGLAFIVAQRRATRWVR
jgi:hypothetical protein